MTASYAGGADDRSAAGVPRLHPGQVTDAAQIRSLLETLRREAAPLTRGFNRRIEVEAATIEEVGAASLVLTAKSFEPDARDIVFLNFTIRHEPYFFQSRVLHRGADSRIEIEIPSVLYQRERRSRERTTPEPAARISLEHRGTADARDLIIADSSPEGIAVDVPEGVARNLDLDDRISVLGQSQSKLYGVVRNKRPGPQPGWTRIGLEIDAAQAAHLEWTVVRDLSPENGRQRLEQTIRIAAGGAQLAFERAIRRFGREAPVAEPNVVDIHDSAGRRIRALVNTWGPASSATAVVVPPAWGRTKETLMPLAATMVECFRRARRPIAVVRFDGINKRGESFRDADCLASGQEQYRFTFSQGVRDIRAVIDHLHADPAKRPKCTILVSFSASSVEARRAVSEDPRIGGWVCVVGTADLQSMMRSISGGIDYALGIERGIKFGLQEILGVSVDMDLAGADAIQHKLAYLSDARREMASIKVPVTWISGRHDAWMDRPRVRDAMSRGDISRRKLIEIPTGHMLKTSRQALGAFQLIAAEVAQMAGGPEIHPATPNVAELERCRLSELRRISLPAVNMRDFWGNYLLGRDRTIGFELMMLTSSYKEFMLRQIEGLGLKDGDMVVDVGSGTGGLPFYLGSSKWSDKGVGIVELDFVREGLNRARSRLDRAGKLKLGYVEADVGLARDSGVPIASNSVDAVLASLFLSYVPNPRAVLRELQRILRPGGRIVVSTLRRDADMSKLFSDGAAELKERWSAELASWAGNVEFEDAIRGYMNEASRLLDLEERGRFVFWDPLELKSLLETEFGDVQIEESFGHPPQAAIAAARRV